VEQTPAAAAGLDADSAEWLRVLAGAGPQREAALARLHEMLLRIARGEVRRRGPRLQLTGPELDDLAYQAAADALSAITGKLGQFRGESRFTTWAYKFVIFEVLAKIGRHLWRHPSVPLDTDDWDRLPGRFGFDPAREAEWRDLLAALRDEAPDRRHCGPPGSPDRITLLVPRCTDGHADTCARAGQGRPYARSACSGRFICVSGPG
jgi:RNA polymerase sigma-70 factor (ECF subfamily)